MTDRAEEWRLREALLQAQEVIARSGADQELRDMAMHVQVLWTYLKGCRCSRPKQGHRRHAGQALLFEYDDHDENTR